jgi:hypothetical protein
MLLVNSDKGKRRADSKRHNPPGLTSTSAGAPLEYLVTPDPVISSDIVAVPPGGFRAGWLIRFLSMSTFVKGDLAVRFVVASGGPARSLNNSCSEEEE